MTFWRIIEGDCREALAALDTGSVHTVVTSPPYFGLRDYGHDRQIGLEATPDEFVEALVGVFREVRRVLRDDGTVWLNLGDSYAGSWGAQGRTGRMADRSVISARQIEAHPKKASRTGSIPDGADYKAKDLLGIPWMVAFALRADGWYLRSDIIWHKPNPMPESVKDRPTRAHEFIFLLSKRDRYYYDADAIREPLAETNAQRTTAHYDTAARYGAGNGGNGGLDGLAARMRAGEHQGANKRSVWTVTTKPFAGAHFATFPPDLIEPCILAGCPERACSACGAPWERVTEREGQGWDGSRYGARAATGGAVSGGTARSTPGSSNGKLTGKVRTLGFEASCECAAEPTSGVVLDPFAGAGTTGLVALRHGRSFIGIELNPEYAEMARERIRDDAPLLNVGAEAAEMTVLREAGC